jgi:hypothetical protein
MSAVCNRVRKGHGQSDLVAIMGIGDRVDDGHRSRQGEFEPVSRMGAGNLSLKTVDVTLSPQRSGDGRHFRVAAIAADAHRNPPGKIDTLDVFEEAVHEMLTRLLAIGDNIDPGILLLLQRQKLRVVLSLGGASPSNCQGAYNIRGLASHAGFGKLPAIVVSTMSYLLSSTLGIGGLPDR